MYSIARRDKLGPGLFRLRTHEHSIIGNREMDIIERALAPRKRLKSKPLTRIPILNV